MKIRTFLILSVIVHVLLLAGIYFLPPPKPDSKQEFVTTLVFPEELNTPAKPPRLTPVPPIKPQTAPPVQTRKKTPSQDKPDVPGSGWKSGKPRPQGITPEGGLPESAPEEPAHPEYAQEAPADDAGQVKPGYDGRPEIFDKDIISSIAQGDHQGRPQGFVRDKTMTFNTAEYRYTGYMSKLKERIESIWIYPLEARMNGIYGDLRIRFTIKKNGRLQGVELIRTSGYKMLDDAALKALKDGEPYWPLPDEWGMDSYTIHGHFIYSMYGFYVR